MAQLQAAEVWLVVAMIQKYAARRRCDLWTHRANLEATGNVQGEQECCHAPQHPHGQCLKQLDRRDVRRQEQLHR